ncbi:MAG: hypothetical protein V3R94_13125 [Acidobacteriota bacterium]
MTEFDDEAVDERESNQPERISPPLKNQAHNFRQGSTSQARDFYERPLAGWKQVLYLVMIMGSLLSVVYLLIVDDSRQRLVASAGTILYPGEPDDINRLPPPPPKVIQARVVTVAGGGGAPPGQDEPRGVLFRDLDPVRIGAEEEAPPAPIELPRTEASQDAFNLLLSLSDAAAQLSRNTLEELEFTRWRPVKDQPPEFWIDLVAVRKSDGEEVHLIWSVNTEGERVSALSQAARDLEPANKRRGEAAPQAPNLRQQATE